VQSCENGTTANGRAASAGVLDPMSLHIGIEHGRGGEARVVSELMRSLPEAGFGFRGLVGAPANAGELSGGRVRSFAPAQAGLLQRLCGARRAIGSTLEELQPAIVASHFALYTAPALDLLKGRRLVSHFHGPWYAESLEEGKGRVAARVKSRLEAVVYRRADRVIVLSEAFARLVTESFGVAPERVRRVPGSVDIERFALRTPRAESRAALGLPPGGSLDRPVLVSVRRLVNRMGLATLIEAMPAIVAAVPEVLLCIAGTGPLRPALEEQVDRLGLREQVRFLGFVTEAMLPHLFYAADLNLVPTTALEGFGLVAAEAMATGTPSMVTPVGGLPEVVGGLSEDLVFAGSDAGAIAEGVIQALRGGIQLPTREACRAYVEENFSSRLMAERTAAVYRELLGEEASA
jgi:glycosyltransferase involved in cell wall biosynthesis